MITDRPRLQALVGPLSGAINGLIDSQVREFIASDAFADFWVAANTRAHSRRSSNTPDHRSPLIRQ